MIAIVVPCDLEVPFIVEGLTLGHVVDFSVNLGFDEDGALCSVDAGPLLIDRSDKDTNARAIWTAACAKVDADHNLRLEVEMRINALEPYYDNSPEALRRDLGHQQRELI